MIMGLRCNEKWKNIEINVCPSGRICYILIENIQTLFFDSLIYLLRFSLKRKKHGEKKIFFSAHRSLQTNFHSETILNNLRELKNLTRIIFNIISSSSRVTKRIRILLV